MTVYINGRTAVHAGSQGELRTDDPCRLKGGGTTTFSNVARSADAAQTAATVSIDGNGVCHRQSIFARSTGDEPGEAGVRSGTIGAQANFVTASSNVFFEGVPAVRQNDLMVSNNRNTPPAPLFQPGGQPPPPLAAEVEQIDRVPEAVHVHDIDRIGDGVTLPGTTSATNDG